MDILFSVTDFPGIPDPVIFRAYETTAPNTLVSDSGLLSPPHSSPRNIVIPGVEPVPHFVRLYQVPGGVGTGVLRKEFWQDPTFKTVNSEETLFYYVGGAGPNDPIPGSNQLRDTYLAGKNFTVERRGTGTLVPSGALTTYTEYTVYNPGGFDLYNPGDEFNEGEIIIVRVKATVGTSIPVASAVSLFNSIRLVEGDVTLTSSDLKKLIDVQSLTSRITITLDPLVNFPANALIPIVSNKGSQINVVVKASGTEKFEWDNELFSELYLNMSDQLWIARGVSTWKVVKGSNCMLNLGQRILSDTVKLNCLKLDRAEYDKLDYPALWWYLNTKLASSQKKTYVQAEQTQVIDGETIYINRGFFAIDTVGGKFKVPDDRNKIYKSLKTFDGVADANRVENIAGGYQHRKVGKHRHYTFGNESDNTGATISETTYPTFQGESNGDFKYTIRGKNTPPTLGLTSDGGGAGNWDDNTGLIAQVYY